MTKLQQRRGEMRFCCQGEAANVLNSSANPDPRVNARSFRGGSSGGATPVPVKEMPGTGGRPANRLGLPGACCSPALLPRKPVQPRSAIVCLQL